MQCNAKLGIVVSFFTVVFVVVGILVWLRTRYVQQKAENIARESELKQNGIKLSFKTLDKTLERIKRQTDVESSDQQATKPPVNFLTFDQELEYNLKLKKQKKNDGEEAGETNETPLNYCQLCKDRDITVPLKGDKKICGFCQKLETCDKSKNANRDEVLKNFEQNVLSRIDKLLEKVEKNSEGKETANKESENKNEKSESHEKTFASNCSMSDEHIHQEQETKVEEKSSSDNSQPPLDTSPSNASSSNDSPSNASHSNDSSSNASPSNDTPSAFPSNNSPSNDSHSNDSSLNVSPSNWAKEQTTNESDVTKEMAEVNNVPDAVPNSATSVSLKDSTNASLNSETEQTNSTGESLSTLVKGIPTTASVSEIETVETSESVSANAQTQKTGEENDVSKTTLQTVGTNETIENKNSTPITPSSGQTQTSSIEQATDQNETETSTNDTSEKDSTVISNSKEEIEPKDSEVKENSETNVTDEETATGSNEQEITETNDNKETAVTVETNVANEATNSSRENSEQVEADQKPGDQSDKHLQNKSVEPTNSEKIETKNIETKEDNTNNASANMQSVETSTAEDSNKSGENEQTSLGPTAQNDSARPLPSGLEKITESAEESADE